MTCSKLAVSALTASGLVLSGLLAPSAGAASDPLQIPTELELSAAKTVVTFPHNPALRGTLTSTDVTGGPLEHQWVLLQRRDDDRWQEVRGKYTDNEGQVSFSPGTPHRTRYRLHFGETPSYEASNSDPIVIEVRPRLRADFPAIAKTFTKSAITGQVGPQTRGQVRLQRWRDGSWHRVDRDQVNSRGRFTLHFEPKEAGSLKLRVRWMESHRLLQARTPPERVEVVARELQAGDSGRDVRTLQERLRHLHYDIGKVDGEYGYSTTHAVSAFQKVQRSRVTGRVTTKTWKQLADPRRIKMQHPRDGAAVEVNVRRQVVLYAVDGKVKRILDSSTGGEYYYTNSSGGTSKAHTPRGHFSFQYKVNGWREAELGKLYRPAYFTNDGYAIHGSNSVPAQPASHGCVRITVPAMDRMYDKFDVGMSVWIYGKNP